MGEFLRRGYQVTVFCPSSPKYKNTLLQGGLHAVRVVGYDPASDSKSKSKLSLSSLQTILTMLNQGGPLAKLSRNIFSAIVADYTNKALPLAIISDFFSTSALDAGDYLSIPTIGLFPNPIGLTPLLAPHLRGWCDMPHVWACWLGEAILARALLFFRNRERSHRALEYRLPPLIEQDIYPSICMRRPFLASTALGFEYAFPQSPLLCFTGPSPPCNALTRDLHETDPELFMWLEQQEAVVYVAFGTMHHFTEASVNALYEQLNNITSMANPNTFFNKRVSVLWSLPSDQQALLNVSRSNTCGGKEHDRAANVGTIRLEAFVPQWDVLASPRVKVFVSHCGANSLYEALLNGTPLVCCPGKADQPANAARILSARAGVLSPRGVHSVEASLLEVFGALESYSAHADSIKNLFLSEGGATKGADFVEQIITCGVKRLSPHESYCGRYSWTRWTIMFFLVVATLALQCKYSLVASVHI